MFSVRVYCPDPRYRAAVFENTKTSVIHARCIPLRSYLPGNAANNTLEERVDTYRTENSFSSFAAATRAQARVGRASHYSRIKRAVCGWRFNNRVITRPRPSKTLITVLPSIRFFSERLGQMRRRTHSLARSLARARRRAGEHAAAAYKRAGAR